MGGRVAKIILRDGRAREARAWRPGCVYSRGWMSQPAASAFPCSNCGAKLAFDAAAQAMACPYCGTKQAVTPAAAPGAGAQAYARCSSTKVSAWQRGAMNPGHRDRLQGVRRQRQRGRRGANDHLRLLRLEPGACGGRGGAAYPPREPPPFPGDEGRGEKRFSGVARVALAATERSEADRAEVVRAGAAVCRGRHEMGGVYVPFWTFDADATSRWTAERGWHYYETEVYVETVNGQEVERTREVQRTRWEPAIGMSRDRFDDVLVCAGRALPGELVESSRPSTRSSSSPTARSFSPDGAPRATRSNLQPASAIAQQKMARVQEGRCGSDVGGTRIEACPC